MGQDSGGWQLFRHFVRGPDGSVCEVLTEPDLTSPENYHYGLNCWNPRRIDFWLQKVLYSLVLRFAFC